MKIIFQPSFSLGDGHKETLDTTGLQRDQGLIFCPLISTELAGFPGKSFVSRSSLKASNRVFLMRVSCRDKGFSLKAAQ